MRNTLLIVLLFLVGCAGPTHEVEPEFRPVETIRERPRLLRNLGSKTAISTVGRHCYVYDLDEWLGRNPPGSVKYKAVMRHEQEHSRRQLDMGTFLWITRYGVDKDFALLEEQIGFYYEMTEKRRMGTYVDAHVYATILSNYKIPTGKLISYDKALIWATQVLRGEWTPPND